MPLRHAGKGFRISAESYQSVMGGVRRRFERRRVRKPDRGFSLLVGTAPRVPAV